MNELTKKEKKSIYNKERYRKNKEHVQYLEKELVRLYDNQKFILDIRYELMCMNGDIQAMMEEFKMKHSYDSLLPIDFPKNNVKDKVITCSICHGVIQKKSEIFNPKCKHKVHASCFLKLALSSNTQNVNCPVCRTEIHTLKEIKNTDLCNAFRFLKNRVNKIMFYSLQFEMDDEDSDSSVITE